LIVVFEILPCLEFDKHRIEKDQKTQNNGGERTKSFSKTVVKAVGKCLPVSHPEPLPLRPSGLAGWAGLASPRPGLDQLQTLLKPQAFWVRPGALHRGVGGETRGQLGFRHFRGASGDLHISYVKFCLQLDFSSLLISGEIKNSEISLIWDSLRSTRPLFPSV
jgi:hypothetical protein